ncbi:MAG TPA: regulatory protein GemA [Candidatus Binataceae bacterium]|nr:regulatory protein GemA [Candidatus Binataceae bacterium]
MKNALTSPAIERGRRNAELAAIHVAKKKLGMDDATYRDFLFAQTGHYSAAELDQGQRTQAIEALRRAGFRRTPVLEKQLAGVGGVDAQILMIRTLWNKLKFSGALGRDSSERRLNRFAARVTGVDSIGWMSAADLVKVIEGLKNWLSTSLKNRHGAED